MTHDTKNGTHDVLAKIRAGEVRMRSKGFFMARAALTTALIILILILSSTIASFVLFSLRETGHEFLLGFGGRGIAAFFALFPWPLLSVDLALLFLLDWLLRGFSFGYKYSFVSVFLALFIASTLLALVINATAFHRTLESHADHGDLPVAGLFYEETRREHHEFGIFRGVVESVGTSSFVMAHDNRDQDVDDPSFTVYLPPNTPFAYSIGTRVFVLGNPIGSTTIRAEQVRVFLPRD